MACTAICNSRHAVQSGILYGAEPPKGLLHLRVSDEFEGACHGDITIKDRYRDGQYFSTAFGKGDSRGFDATLTGPG
jgi:hypothetical protein